MRRAFTLIEIVVAMAILIIVVASTFAIFRASASSWRKGQVRALRYQEARFILGRMSKEIASSYPVSLAGPYCLGTPDKFYFITSLADAPASLMEVGYWLDASSQNLMRNFQSFPDYDFSTYEQEELLSGNVAALNFRYSTGELWQDNWDSRSGGGQSGMLPKAVKIELVIQDEKGPQQETFDTIVTLPAAAD